MNTIKTLVESGVLSTVIALFCALQLLYFSVTGKGTDRDLLMVLSMLLVAIYGRQK